MIGRYRELSKAKRRGLWSAAFVLVVAGAAAAILLPSTEAPRAQSKPEGIAAEGRPVPLVAKKEKRKAERPKKKQKGRKRGRAARIKVDRNAANPVAISIPSVDIQARVIPLGLKPDKSLEVPEDFSEAGWRTGGPEPGEKGPALITAHVDSRAGPAAFFTLDEVNKGDEIRVRRADGSTVIFEAMYMEEAPKTSFPTSRVYGKTKYPSLRVVTCDAPFDSATRTYKENLIVYARRKPS